MTIQQLFTTSETIVCHEKILNATDLNTHQQPNASMQEMHHSKFKTPIQAGISDVLNKLREFMLYDTTVAQQSKTQEQQSKPQAQTKPQEQQSKTNENAFQPPMHQDVLFWCFYVMQNGTFKYEQITNRYTTEQDTKRDQVLLLRKHIKELKQATGIKITASTIENDIATSHITPHAFQVLVHLNSLNAVIVNPHNRVYAEFISDAVSDKPTYIIKRMDKKTRRVCMTTATEKQLTSLRETHYRIENLHKPIKSMSAYTVADLTEMCHKLKIQLKPKMKKQEIYDTISKQLFL